jgi:DNA-binding transcriptional LysR family regulator
MRPVRVLFGALPAALHTALSEAIRSQQDIEVGTLRADVVVVATVGCVLPGIASHLLDQYPHLRVVAVTSDGRRALVSVMRPYVEHIAVPSPADLVRAMRSLGEPDD